MRPWFALALVPVLWATPAAADTLPASRRQFAVLRELGEPREAILERQEVAASSCALATPGSASVPTTQCLRCHAIHGHPVGLDYAGAYAHDGRSLRSAAEVVRRGVLLPDGRMECVSCHDGRSPWKHRIAIPPGAPVIPAVVAGQADTYPRGNWRLAPAEPVARLSPGSAVSPAPLCAACHTMAD